jgi:hypothetical protein
MQYLWVKLTCGFVGRYLAAHDGGYDALHTNGES